MQKLNTKKKQVPSNLYVEPILDHVNCSAKIERIACPLCLVQMKLGAQNIDYDTIDELTGECEVEYVYVCQPCNVKTKSNTKFPRITLDTGSGEPFSVVPA